MIIAGVLWVAMGGLVGCGGEVPRRPDIVLITLDTTRADRLGAYGCPRPNSPNFDRFARQAVLYERAWSTASWTLPAHASMLTGKHPTSHGAHFAGNAGDASLADVFARPGYQKIRANRLGDEHVTLAELLGEAGYETAAFVAGPWLTPAFGVLQGYEVQDAEMPEVGGRPAGEITDKALAWLGSVPERRPLHLFVNYFDPHEPYAPLPGYDRYPAAHSPIVIEDVAVNRGVALPPNQRAAYLDRYDGEIQYMDAQLGRLLAGLRDAGRWDHALIIIVADHGESFGEHGLMGHGFGLYEELLRVPLLVRFPGGGGAGTASRETVSVVDLFPMAARVANLALPAGVEGVLPGRRRHALAETMRSAYLVKRFGPRFDHDAMAFVEWPSKLIIDESGTAELFNLTEDEAEVRNLAAGPETRTLAAKLLAARNRLVPARGKAAIIDAQTRERLRSLGYLR